MDAVYYILAARKSLGLADIDEIIIGGDRLTRAQVTPVLRRYVRYVMPAIFLRLCCGPDERRWRHRLRWF